MHPCHLPYTRVCMLQFVCALKEREEMVHDDTLPYKPRIITNKRVERECSNMAEEYTYTYTETRYFIIIFMPLDQLELQIIFFVLLGYL